MSNLGFTGVFIIFHISAQNHRLWVLVRTALDRRVFVIRNTLEQFSHFIMKTCNAILGKRKKIDP